MFAHLGSRCDNLWERFCIISSVAPRNGSLQALRLFPARNSQGLEELVVPPEPPIKYVSQLGSSALDATWSQFEDTNFGGFKPVQQSIFLGELFIHLHFSMYFISPRVVFLPNNFISAVPIRNPGCTLQDLRQATRCQTPAGLNLGCAGPSW
jgi:hypothetical protein